MPWSSTGSVQKLHLSIIRLLWRSCGTLVSKIEIFHDVLPLFQCNLLRLDCRENLHTGQSTFSQHFLILQHFNAMSRWPQGIWGTSATAGLFQCNFGNRKFAKLLCIGGVSSCNLDFLLPGTSIEELGKGWPVPVTQIGSTVPQRIHVLARDNAVDCWRMHSMLHELYP